MSRKKRIFIGVSEVSGFGIKFKEAFNKIGVKADFYEYNPHPFGFRTDKLIKYSDNVLVRKFQKIFLILKLVLKYDYFLYLSTNSLFPDFKDVKILKKFGKKTMIMFTGCDVRIPEAVAVHGINPCAECNQEFKDYVGCFNEIKKVTTRKAEAVFDLIGSPMEAADYLTRPYYNWFGQFDPAKFPKERYSNYKLHDPIRILHTPSHPVYKGTKYIYEAIDKLKLKHKFEFKAIRNISYDEYLRELEETDLVIDQLLLGTYGSVGIEAMFMYKPVVCYLRPDFLKLVGDDCPVYNATGAALYNVLDDILSNPAQLIDASKRSRIFVEKFHTDTIVAQNVYNYFENSAGDK